MLLRPLRTLLATAGLCTWLVPLTFAQAIVVDNADPGFSVLSETWFTTSVDGQYGDDYRYRTTGGTIGAVEWRPDLPETGEYAVAVWYRNSNDRPSDARYTIQHAGGSNDVLVDQRLNGSQWVPIGTFDFAAGTTGRVTLTSDAEAGKTIVADAVQFLPQFTNGAEAPEMRACWLTQYLYLGKTDDQLRSITRNIRAGNMNTVYVTMYGAAQTYWPSKAYQAAGGSWASNTTDHAQRLIRIFHEEGLKVGAWIEYGLAIGFLNHPIAQAHPDWLARDRFGDPVTGENGGFVFISPASPGGTDMLVEMCRELAANYNFDDIQLDRVRWGRKDTGREYGYEDVCANLYQATYGSSPPNNVNHPQWVEFREGLVNDVMQRCYNAIKAENPNIVVSSAPTGSYGITQHMQRWSDWVQGGYLDLCMPQMYLTSFDGFVTEFDTQVAQAPNHLDKLAVGYRASDDNDWQLVADQMNYARSNGVNHGTLWVYHQYTSQVAIQDEINNLPQFGEPWAQPAYNPFASDRMLQIVVDNDDLGDGYAESGAWVNSAQPGFFRFDSRVVSGAAPATATFSADVPKSGRFDVYVWYTEAGNRNAAAQYTIHHRNGDTTVTVDQTSGGGQWINIGRHIFESSAAQPLVTVSNIGTGAETYTSSDAVKLTLSGFALGDADGDGAVTAADLGIIDCLTSPGGGPVDATCEVYDFDDDGDADLLDLADFQSVFGAGQQ